MKAKVTVALKPGVLDPQGAAIAQALVGLGFDEIRGARVGKTIELELEGDDPAAAEARLREMCERLLANPVIEDYAVALEPPR
jgi:phosphoribosylformylglycinamidine synthase